MIAPLFADQARDLVPGLADGSGAVRDRQLYRTTADERDPGAADRIEVESETDAIAAMAIERPNRDEMPMPIERGDRR